MDRKTVLVVDDHAPTRQAYAALLEDSGYRVLEAANGGEAIVLVRSRAPDVVVMDIVMPVVSGLEAAESLRDYPVTARIPILGVTATAGRVERERMRRICDDLLPKPCDPEEILSRIRHLAGDELPRRRCLEHLEAIGSPLHTAAAGAPGRIAATATR